MARDTLLAQGGRDVMLRGEVVAQIDELADAIELITHRGIRKGEPDRAGVIGAAVALILENAELRKRLQERVAPLVQELRQREEDKIARRERSGGRRGRPRVPEAAFVKEFARARSGGRIGQPPGGSKVPDLYDGVAPAARAPAGRSRGTR
jgi:regulator of replication initiation timing